MVQIGVDVGGTFTDVVCLDADGRVHIAKVPTTPRHIVDGILEGARKVLEVAGLRPADVTRFIHSTTIATNAILEHKGAVCALLTTEGFEDILEIGRQKRWTMYDLNVDAQTPVFLAPRRLRVGIPERVDVDGTVRKPLDEAALILALRSLVEQYSIEAVAVSFLFSFANPVNERRARDLIRANFPRLAVSISSDVDPVFREYERTCLTCFDAYVRPGVGTYIHELSGALREVGISCGLNVMQSRGGITSAAIASEKPASMLLSGPAAGVVGACYVGALSGYGNLITIDIGGTSCDVALVREGKPMISREGRIGSFPLRMSMVDVQTIGAGGGSLVSRDASGGVHVGPESAGSEPGPICYRRGGTVPTVTDASLVLGYLNPTYFAGGRFALDRDAASEAIGRFARQLELGTEAMAAGIHRIINERMANEIRLVSIKRGHDPRHFSLTALGGAGPVHGGRLSALLSIPTMIVPDTPGVLCAFGLLVSNIEHEQTRTVGARTREVEPSRITNLFAEVDAICAERMERDARGAAATRQHFIDIRYAGQSFELEIPVSTQLSHDVLQAAEAEFHKLHRQIFGYDRPDSATEIINLRTVHTLALTASRPVVAANANGNLAGALKESRPVYFDEFSKFRDTRIYDRQRLPVGERILGPAIIEQLDTTTVLYPGQVAELDAVGNLVVTIGKDA